ncbi:MAG: hypothetical protein EP320_00845 [Rhodobacteraceae bacterium]|nr:MAG: hypothetical protein EP320_00845 [Paracoccaceae bacterium]
MKLAQIENGVVMNIIKVDPANVPEWASGWPTAEEVRIGQLYDGNAFSDPTPEPLPDPVIAWRQTAWREKTKFLIWAKRIGLISANEYLAACRGEWPASFTDALSSLPGNIDPIEAQGVFAAASEFWRMDPVLNAVAADKGVSDAELDVGFGWVGD